MTNMFWPHEEICEGHKIPHEHDWFWCEVASKDPDGIVVGMPCPGDYSWSFHIVRADLVRHGKVVCPEQPV